MIRIISSFVPKQSLFVMCDNATCGHYISQEIDPLDQKGSIEGIIKTAGALLGWSIGLFGHICPEHVKEQMEMIKQQGRVDRKLVVLAPSGLDHKIRTN